jgi:hypothetical protein
LEFTSLRTIQGTRQKCCRCAYALRLAQVLSRLGAGVLSKPFNSDAFVSIQDCQMVTCMREYACSARDNSLMILINSTHGIQIFHQSCRQCIFLVLAGFDTTIFFAKKKLTQQ